MKIEIKKNDVKLRKTGGGEEKKIWFKSWIPLYLITILRNEIKVRDKNCEK